MTTSPSAQVPISAQARRPTAARPASPLGVHRVLDPPGVLPQAAWRLDPDPAIAPDEVRVRVDRLNLDAASYRQLREAYAGDPDKIRAAVAGDHRHPGQDAEPGHRVGRHADRHGRGRPARGPRSACKPGQRIATLVSLTLTPLAITDAPGTAGTASPSRSPARGTPSCSPGRSPPSCPTTSPCRCRWRSWTCAAPPP